jgi:hypothetical protein
MGAKEWGSVGRGGGRFFHSIGNVRIYIYINLFFSGRGLLAGQVGLYRLAGITDEYAKSGFGV